MNVSGVGSAWNCTRALYISHLGTGTLSVTSGGIVSNSYSYVGYAPNGNGEVNVSGSGSAWNSTNGLYVGGGFSCAGGTGSVTISDGGLVAVSGSSSRVWSSGTIDIQNGGTFHLQSGTLTNDGMNQLATGGTLINDSSIQGSLSVTRDRPLA